METKEIRKALPECKKAWDQEKHKVSTGLQGAIDTLFKCTEALCDRVDYLEDRLDKIEKKVSKNSSNSSKPPSSDEFREPKRKRSGKKRGGQNGHKGSTLKKVLNPDKKVIHTLPEQCPYCHNFVDDKFKKIKKRQVWDIIIKREVTEHEIEEAKCSCCHQKVIAPEGKGIQSNVQYGSGVRALVSYLQGYQLIPYERIQNIFRDIFDMSLCKGTAFNITEKSFNLLEEFENKVKEALLNSKINHADETPIKIDGKRHHLHVLSNEAYTLLSHDKGRGMKAVKSIGVLKKFKGILVHDCFSMYFNYGKKHAICNAHLLRELKFVEEIIGQRWAHKMSKFLFDANEYVKELKRESRVYVPPDELNMFLKEFDKILFEAEVVTSKLIENGGKGTQDPSYNLFKRVKKRRKDVLHFLEDFDVPFTNNLAERDLRMVKVHQKITGGWRTEKGAKMYARLRSFISTVNKQGFNVYQGLKNTFERDQNILKKLSLSY